MPSATFGVTCGLSIIIIYVCRRIHVWQRTCSAIIDLALICTDEDWPDTNVRFNSSASGDESSSGDIGDPIISDAITAYAGPVGNDSNNYGYTYITNWKNLTKKADYTIPSLMLQAAIAPITLADGTYSMDPKGALWVRNYGSRFPLRGGYWFYGSPAGLFALSMIYSRSSSSITIGFRVAFVG